MLKKNQVIDAYNENLCILQREGRYIDLHPLTEERFQQWIKENKLPDREDYAKGDIIPPMLDLHQQEEGREKPTDNEVYYLHYLGKSVPEIAAELGISESTVKRRLRHLVMFGCRGKYIRNGRIQYLYGDGFPVSFIASFFEISVRRVYQILNLKSAKKAKNKEVV